MVPETFLNLATQINLVDLVVVGDHLVRKDEVGRQQLVEFCEGATGPGSVPARRAAGYVRDRVDSPMETRLRMLLVLAGLPEPEVNPISRDLAGEPIRRHDLCWPEAKSIAEYDGRQHAETDEQWERDLARREAIDDDEWRILVVTAKGIGTHPERTLARVQRLLVRRGLPGVPRRLSDDGRPYFPGRG